MGRGKDCLLGKQIGERWSDITEFERQYPGPMDQPSSMNHSQTHALCFCDVVGWGSGMWYGA